MQANICSPRRDGVVEDNASNLSITFRTDVTFQWSMGVEGGIVFDGPSAATADDDMFRVISPPQIRKRCINVHRTVW